MVTGAVELAVNCVTVQVGFVFAENNQRRGSQNQIKTDINDH